ncbi:MAG TPA: TSUP family transporter [Myxococcales bacterium]|nr:TSUP family transporter [Myxococcales bacterium]
MAAASLALLVGVTLGLLGGGGSILTVPLFLGVLHQPPRQAIAWSLLVVSATAASAAAGHAWRGQVQWRRGLLFAAASMAGAFLGARTSRLVPETALVVGFAAAMLVTGAAMIRRRRLDGVVGAEPASAREAPLVRVAALALAVGFAAGMVGAGGGFLIVPALVLGAGVPMRSAVGTSLLVLSLQSAAGFAGHAGAVPLDWAVILPVTAASVAGGLVGSLASSKLPASALRSIFGWGVVAMAFYLLGHQLPPELRSGAAYRALLVERWPWWAGGAAIGALVLALLWSENKLLGVSTGCAELSEVPWTPALRSSWRVWFVGGIALGGLWAGMLAGGGLTLASPWVDSLAGAARWLKWPLLLGAGGLIGYGTRQAGGCTSGHGIVGTAQLARSSLLATGTFMAAGFLTTQLLARWPG